MLKNTLNRTDLRILEFCSRSYSYFSAAEIARGSGLHVTTISQRLNVLYNKLYMKRKERGKGFAYRFNFISENARKFRLFIDMDFVFSLNIEKLNKFIENNRNNQNILSCLIYGSAPAAKDFNDIDLLIIYDKEEVDAKGFDAFQMDAKTFRNLFSLGEPRLQAALATGIILIDRGFIFDYLEHEIPVKPSENILFELRKKYEHILKTIETSKTMKKNELQEKIIECLEAKAMLEFLSNSKTIPNRIDFQKELIKLNPKLSELMNSVKNTKKQKALWDLFYSKILTTDS